MQIKHTTKYITMMEMCCLLPKEVCWLLDLNLEKILHLTDSCKLKSFYGIYLGWVNCQHNRDAIHICRISKISRYVLVKWTFSIFDSVKFSIHFSLGQIISAPHFGNPISNVVVVKACPFQSDCSYKHYLSWFFNYFTCTSICELSFDQAQKVDPLSYWSYVISSIA